MDRARLERIPAFLDEHYVRQGKLPHAAVLVARRGEIVHRSAIGEARRGEPLKDDAIFRIASMTKPITSVAFMMLVEEGKVALDTPLHAVLPQFKDTGVFVAGGGAIPFVTRPPARPILMVDLLRHTAGLTYGFQERNPVDAAYRAQKIDDFDADQSTDEFIERIAKLPLLFDPGTRWCYSMATDVLGAVIEKVEGRPFADVLKARLFDPLGMKDTGFEVPESERHRVTDAFVFHPQGKRLWDSGADSRWARSRRFHSGGGGLVSTLDDYYRFCAMLLGDGALDGTRIISRRTLEQMGLNHLPGGGDLTEHSIGLFSEDENAGVGFGLGFATTIDPAATLLPASVGDLYWGGMFSTGFFVDPAEQLAMVFMTQLSPSSTYKVRRELKTLVHAAIAD